MIFDCHNDILTSGLGETTITETIRAYNGRVVCALWTTDGASLDFAAKIKSRIDFRFAVEDMGFYSEGDEEKLIALAPLYCSLTWNNDNRFAGGALGTGGLTSDGVKLLQLFERSGIKTDTAHLNRKSFFGVAEQTEKIFCSHTSVDELCHNPRNLTNEQIRIIKERGGIVGLTPINKFNLLPFDLTIDYFVQKYGTETIAIGSDFFGSTDFPDDLKNYDDFGIVKEKLRARGYAERDLDKIFHGNAERFFGMV